MLCSLRRYLAAQFAHTKHLPRCCIGPILRRLPLRQWRSIQGSVQSILTLNVVESKLSSCSDSGCVRSTQNGSGGPVLTQNPKTSHSAFSTITLNAPLRLHPKPTFPFRYRLWCNPDLNCSNSSSTCTQLTPKSAQWNQHSSTTPTTH